MKSRAVGFVPLALFNFCLVLPPGGSTGRGSLGFTATHFYNATPNYTAFPTLLFCDKECVSINIIII